MIERKEGDKGSYEITDLELYITKRQHVSVDNADIFSFKPNYNRIKCEVTLLNTFQ